VAPVGSHYCLDTWVGSACSCAGIRWLPLVSYGWCFTVLLWKRTLLVLPPACYAGRTYTSYAMHHSKPDRHVVSSPTFWTCDLDAVAMDNCQFGTLLVSLVADSSVQCTCDCGEQFAGLGETSA